MTFVRVAADVSLSSVTTIRQMQSFINMDQN